LPKIKLFFSKSLPRQSSPAKIVASSSEQIVLDAFKVNTLLGIFIKFELAKKLLCISRTKLSTVPLESTHKYFSELVRKFEQEDKNIMEKIRRTLIKKEKFLRN
tara:strand:+ start:227 stop:538 length:312 start_codon:yes stop_codon:yes gene_type:complete